MAHLPRINYDVHSMPARIDRFEVALTPAIMETAWRYCCRLCYTREDAEDLLQDALAHSITRISQLRDLSKFKSWLLSIVRTQFLMQRRRKAVDKVPIDGEGETGAVLADVRPAPDAGALSGDIAAVMSRLTPEQREILSLFYLEGLSLAETGEVMGISQGAVQQRLFRARAALRRELSRLSTQVQVSVSQFR